MVDSNDPLVLFAALLLSNDTIHQVGVNSLFIQLVYFDRLFKITNLEYEKLSNALASFPLFLP